MASGVSLPAAAVPVKPSTPKRSWTDVFADEMVTIGGRRPDVVAVTAAMLHPVGLAPFQLMGWIFGILQCGLAVETILIALRNLGVVTK